MGHDFVRSHIANSTSGLALDLPIHTESRILVFHNGGNSGSVERQTSRNGSELNPISHKQNIRPCLDSRSDQESTQNDGG